MPRKARAEVDGGLYHVITRGNNRRQIFNSAGDFEKFLSLLAVQKIKLPFFLYAYCLMSNHVHLLIEGKKGKKGVRPAICAILKRRRCVCGLRMRAARPE
jgi:REP element-mobilizing transposase RayT